MWSSRELQGVSRHRAAAARMGQVPGRPWAAVRPLLLLQPRRLRKSFSGGFPPSSHPSPKLPADPGLPGTDLQLD